MTIGRRAVVAGTGLWTYAGWEVGEGGRGSGGVRWEGWGLVGGEGSKVEGEEGEERWGEG